MTKILKAHKGSILSVLSIAMALLTLVALGITGARSGSGANRPAVNKPAAARRDPPALTNAELSLALYQVGLDPEALAAAGLSANQTAVLVGAARTYLTDHIGSLRSDEAALDSASAERDRLGFLVQTGRATADDRTAYATTLASASSAQAAFQADLDAVFTAATSGLGSDTTTLLSTIQASRQTWHLAAVGGRVQYLVAQRSASDWVSLRDALDNARVTARTGEDPDPTLASLLSGVNASSPVSTANANLQANLAAVQSAWTSAVGQ